MKSTAFFIGFTVGLLFSIILIAISNRSFYYDIRSKNPIAPDLTIKIKNGVADTTYWYKK